MEIFRESIVRPTTTVIVSYKRDDGSTIKAWFRQNGSVRMRATSPDGVRSDWTTNKYSAMEFFPMHVVNSLIL